MSDPQEGTRQVACRKCRHFQITYDARQPYGCRAHGFKASQNPALIVYESSGIECQLFETRIRNSESDIRKDHSEF